MLHTLDSYIVSAAYDYFLGFSVFDSSIVDADESGELKRLKDLDKTRMRMGPEVARALLEMEAARSNVKWRWSSWLHWECCRF